MTVLETERLFLRRFTVDDAQFILTLLNEPSFLRYIGDKKIRNLEDARQYSIHPASHSICNLRPTVSPLNRTYTTG
jgi:hypothetical protein